MMRTSFFILSFVFSFAVYSNQCERLKADDNYSKLNDILDCIEEKIDSKNDIKTTSQDAYESVNKEIEPNNRIVEPNIIKLGVLIKGDLSDKNDRDFFRFKAPNSSATIKATVRKFPAEGFSTILSVYDSEEESIGSDSSANEDTASYKFKSKPKSIYYIKIKTLLGDYGPYELLVEETE